MRPLLLRASRDLPLQYFFNFAGIRNGVHLAYIPRFYDAQQNNHNSLHSPNVFIPNFWHPLCAQDRRWNPCHYLLMSISLLWVRWWLLHSLHVKGFSSLTKEANQDQNIKREELEAAAFEEDFRGVRRRGQC